MRGGTTTQAGAEPPACPPPIAVRTRTPSPRSSRRHHAATTTTGRPGAGRRAARPARRRSRGRRAGWSPRPVPPSNTCSREEPAWASGSIVRSLSDRTMRRTGRVGAHRSVGRDAAVVTVVAPVHHAPPRPVAGSTWNTNGVTSGSSCSAASRAGTRGRRGGRRRTGATVASPPHRRGPARRSASRGTTGVASSA